MTGNSSLLIPILPAIVLGLFFSPSIARAQQDPDLKALIEYQTEGSDLSKPHEIEFTLFVPTREAAYRLESNLEKLHFETNVAPEKPGLWLVFATKLMVPTHADLVLIREQLTALASAENGEYISWDMTVAK